MEKNLNKVSNIKYESNVEPNEIIKQYKTYFKNNNKSVREVEEVINNTLNDNKKSKYLVELAMDSKYISSLDKYIECLCIYIYDKKDPFFIVKKTEIYKK